MRTSPSLSSSSPSSYFSSSGLEILWSHCDYCYIIVVVVLVVVLTFPAAVTVTHTATDSSVAAVRWKILQQRSLTPAADLPHSPCSLSVCVCVSASNRTTEAAGKKRKQLKATGLFLHPHSDSAEPNTN